MKTNSSVSPIRAFHGTTAQFNQFLLPENVPGLDPERGDIGIHFGTKKQAAYRVADLSHPRLIEVNLTIHNALVLPDMFSWDPCMIAAKLFRRGIIAKETLALIKVFAAKETRKYDLAAYNIIRRILTYKLYDAIAYKNSIEGPGMSYVVWNPEQIEIVCQVDLPVSEAAGK